MFLGFYCTGDYALLVRVSLSRWLTLLTFGFLIALG